MAKPEAMSGGGQSSKKDVFLQRVLPYVVIAAFGLILLFVVIAVVVSGLVIGGTIQVVAKAIGLTQSLVLFSSIFGVIYVGLHTYAARKAQFEIDRHHREQIPPLHTTIVILSRITVGFWTTALVAVAVTLGSKSTTTNSSSIGALRADLAACTVNCLCMTVVILVIERTKRPFVLPWITPPTPEGQTSSAKAFIQDILVDGVSGQPSSDTIGSIEESTTFAAEGSSRRTSLKSQGIERKHMSNPDVTNGSEAGKPPPTTPAERQRLWHQVDEGGQSSPSPMLPTLSPARKISPRPVKRQSYHKGQRPFYPLPVNFPEGSSSPRATPRIGLRPKVPTNGLEGCSRSFTTSGKKRLVPGESAEGKRLFNRAVEGLRYSRAKGQSVYDDGSNMKVPGSFSGW